MTEPAESKVRFRPGNGGNFNSISDAAGGRVILMSLQ
jgi:hypothetical protein